MEKSLKKVWSALALSFVVVTEGLFAVEDMQVRNLENRVSALEQRRGANGMINPPARPVVKSGVDFWIQAEALLMKATEDGLSYAIDGNSNLIGSPNGLGGVVKNISYDWDWGFRLGVGYNLPHDGWDLLLNWTWFRSGEKASDKEPFSQSIYQTYTAFTNAIPQVGLAKGSSRFHLDFLDFEFGREFFVSKWVTLRPFIGARGGWFTRTFRMKYQQLVSLPLSTISVELQNRFRSGGLRGGLNTQWGLGCGWSFFGDAAASLLYGRQQLHQLQSAQGGLFLNVHNKWTMVRAMTDLSAGLRWDRLLSDDLYRIRLQLAWEQHLLIGFNKDMNFFSNFPVKYNSNQGDVAVSGVSFQARFDF